MVRARWYQDEPSPGFQSRMSFRTGSVVKILLIMNVALFVIEHLLHFAEMPSLFNWLALHPTKFGDWSFFLYLYQLVTYQFLHDGSSLWHLGFNMLMLWFFGRELELALGAKRFLVLYLVGGVMGGLIHIVAGLFSANPLPVVGASGALYGILAYYALKWPNRQVIFIVVRMTARTMALIFVGISVLYGVFPAGGGNTAHLCHLGGALFGFLFFRYEGKFHETVEAFKARQEDRARQVEASKEQEMDRLLQKIHEEGINSLSGAERRFLNEASGKYRK